MDTTRGEFWSALRCWTFRTQGARRTLRALPEKETKMDKTVSDLATAVAGIEDGMTVMIGGFGGSGSPI